MNKSREERIRLYAYAWWEFRMTYGRPGNDKLDWEKACHIVDAEDREDNKCPSLQ